MKAAAHSLLQALGAELPGAGVLVCDIYPTAVDTAMGRDFAGSKLSPAGSVMHLDMELLQGGTGTQFLHVPYKALAEVIPAMLGRQVVATSGGVARQGSSLAMLPVLSKLKNNFRFRPCFYGYVLKLTNSHPSTLQV